MIQIFKDHLKDGLATVDTELPIAHWYLMLTKAVMTLNILQDSRLNPKISAYTYIFGNYDFNTTLIEPPGKKVEWSITNHKNI